jgi:hypothetical protein
MFYKQVRCYGFIRSASSITMDDSTPNMTHASHEQVSCPYVGTSDDKRCVCCTPILVGIIQPIL